MATNPRIPEHRDLPTLVAQKRKRSSAPWVLFGIFVAAIILAAILIWLPRDPRPTNAPSNAAIPSQPTGSQVQLSNIRLSSAPLGGQMYIYARLWNTGQTTINGVLVNVTFPGKDEKPVATFASRVESYANNAAQPLVDAPIKANEAREIRIPIENVPAGWNHQMPEIKVQDVTAFARR